MPQQHDHAANPWRSHAGADPALTPPESLFPAASSIPQTMLANSTRNHEANVQKVRDSSVGDDYRQLPVLQAQLIAQSSETGPSVLKPPEAKAVVSHGIAVQPLSALSTVTEPHTNVQTAPQLVSIRAAQGPSSQDISDVPHKSAASAESEVSASPTAVPSKSQVHEHSSSNQPGSMFSRQMVSQSQSFGPAGDLCRRVPTNMGEPLASTMQSHSVPLHQDQDGSRELSEPAKSVLQGQGQANSSSSRRHPPGTSTNMTDRPLELAPEEVVRPTTQNALPHLPPSKRSSTPRVEMSQGMPSTSSSRTTNLENIQPPGNSFLLPSSSNDQQAAPQATFVTSSASHMSNPTGVVPQNSIIVQSAFTGIYPLYSTLTAQH